MNRIFGSDFAMFFVRTDVDMQYTMFEIVRINVTELDRKARGKPCSKEIDTNGYPGLVMSSSGSSKTLEQCELDYFHNTLGCQLPWGN